MKVSPGTMSAMKLGNPFDRKVFCHIDILASAVIAPTRQPFRILVGKHRPLRFEHCLADDVFRGNELNFVALTGELAPDDVGHLRVGLCQ